MKIAQTLKDKYYSDKIFTAEWILVIVTGLLIFISTAYIDLQSLTIWSTNVWDVIADGNIRNLYEYSAQNIYHVPHAYMGSELMSVLPWSIWNIPIWLMQRFAGVPIISSPFMLAYSKLFLVGLSCVVLHYTYKICMALTNDANKSIWAVFLTASSTFLYTTVCYSGQNDILMMTASVIAVYYLIAGRERAFLLWSAIAISIKPFYLFAFLTVVLLYEKNVIKVMAKAVVSVSGIVLQKLLFMGAPMYKESMSSGPSSSMLNKMFAENLKTAFGPVSFFAIALVLIYFYAYTRNFNKKSLVNSETAFGRYAIYLVTVTYFAYLMFSPFSYYRLDLLVPFLYIVIIQRKNLYLYNVLLETAMSVAMLFKLVLRGSNLFKIRFINGSIFQKLMGFTVDYKHSDYSGVADFLTTKFESLKYMQPLFSGVALITALLLLLLNHPSDKVSLPVDGEKCPRVVFWLRTVILIPFLALVLLLFVKTSVKIY